MAPVKPPAPKTKPTTAAPKPAATSSWKDKFKDIFSKKSDTPAKDTAEQVKDKQSTYSKLKDNTKEVVGRMIGFFVKKDESGDMNKKTPPVKILKGILKLLVETESQRKLEAIDDFKMDKVEERETEKRHKEILKALTIRRKKPKVKKETKKKESPKVTTKGEPAPKGGAPKTTAKPAETAKPSAAPSKPVTPTPSATPSAPTGGTSWVGAATKVAAGAVATTAATGVLAMPSQNVADVIKKASDQVGVPLPLMYAMAKQESNFDPSAAAPTSSAKGLYQFIKGTWNSMVQTYGNKFPILKQKGPEDPEANAIAGALYIKENSTALQKAGIPVNATTIYSAHFLGAGGAKKLLSLPPDTIVANIMPKEASANQYIFYKKGTNGKPDKSQPRSVSEVVQVLFEKVGQYEAKYSQVLQTTAGTQIAQTSVENTEMKVAMADQTPQSKVINNISTTNETSQSQKRTVVVDDRSPYHRVSKG